MKVFTKIIKTCNDCPHHEDCEGPGCSEWMMCRKEGKEIHPRNVIPPWCKLKDYKEVCGENCTGECYWDVANNFKCPRGLE